MMTVYTSQTTVGSDVLEMTGADWTETMVYLADSADERVAAIAPVLETILEFSSTGDDDLLAIPLPHPVFYRVEEAAQTLNIIV